MAIEKIFCHYCRDKLLIEKSEGMVYIYIIYESKNPGTKGRSLKKIMPVSSYDPNQCPICNGKRIQDTK